MTVSTHLVTELVPLATVNWGLVLTAAALGAVILAVLWLQNRSGGGGGGSD